MIQPPFLKKGDKIGIVSPAGKITRKELLPAFRKLKEWGFEAVPGSNLHSSFHQFAGTDKERTEDFQKMLDDESIRGILCSRGGYGSIRLIVKLDFRNFRNNPKWIIGFSDITVFHSLLNRRFNIESVHAVMGMNFPPDGSNNRAINSLKNVLTGERPNYTIPSHPFNRIGECRGQVIGGNLSMLYCTMGTELDIDTRGKILFIEDIDEYLYHIDRMMMAMKLSGKFDRLNALIVGGMTEMNDNEEPFGFSAIKIISDIVKDYSFPVCFNFPAGHAEYNLALIMGRDAELTIDRKESRLRYL